MEFETLIIGTDINAYYMARCFHELYNKPVTLIGKESMAFTSYSDITNVIIEPNLWDSQTFKDTLKEYALKIRNNNKNKKILLIATNDYYVRLIVENRKTLEKYFVFNYPNLEIVDACLVKDKFYETFKNSNLDLPNTYIYKCNNGQKIKQKFIYPLILKPGDGFLYHKHEFEGMSKVYKIKSEKDMYEVINKIEQSGYNGNLVLQEFIPGDDSCLYDSIFYVGKDKKVKLMTFAWIGLQERTHTAIGNCTVLVNGVCEHEYPTELISELKRFMETIGYQGFAEFDLKYDFRDKKYKVLEINPRQARSSYYLTACGHNLVKYLIDDLIYNKDIKTTLLKDKIVLSMVPKNIIEKYVTNNKLKNEITKLINDKKIVNPLKYDKDKNFKRKIYLALRDINYIKKYKNNTF